MYNQNRLLFQKKKIDAVGNINEKDRHITYNGERGILKLILLLKRSVPNDFRIIWPKFKKGNSQKKNSIEELQNSYTTL